jgi:hypothetical protein
MSASLFGSLVGVGVGLVFSSVAAYAGHARKQTSKGRSAVVYPPPDWWGFTKRAATVFALLGVIYLLGEVFQVNQRGYEAVLFVSHVMAFAGTTMEFVGVLWATWQAFHRAPDHQDAPASTDV